MSTRAHLTRTVAQDICISYLVNFNLDRVGFGFFCMINASFESTKFIYFVETTPTTTTKTTEGLSFFILDICLQFEPFFDNCLMDTSHREMDFGFENIIFKSLCTK